jgi:hypothetical protein
MQIYPRELESGLFEPVHVERDLFVGQDCGGYDGVSEFLFGDGPCDYLEASNLK